MKLLTPKLAKTLDTPKNNKKFANVLRSEGYFPSPTPVVDFCNIIHDVLNAKEVLRICEEHKVLTQEESINITNKLRKRCLAILQKELAPFRKICLSKIGPTQTI